ncbi:MAG TPA: septum formation initiator family protein [Candidatus Omnitrophota bacterium]|nr:septum formation initiator family protein [Candidatus Omnitrophota bacterium]HPS19675.1 septum formation initiator family protein [Candidatus Omnitrophota bacterium]
MEGKKVILNLAVVGAIIVVVFLPGFSELEKLRDENEAVRRRIDVLKQQNAMLREEIRLMHENPDYVEQKARGKLGIVRKEEYIYEGLQKQSPSKTPATKNKSTSSKTSKTTNKN